MNSKEGIEATIWRILRDVWIRALGGDPMTMTDPEANSLVDPYTSQMLEHQRVLMHVVTQARRQGLEQMHAKLHAGEGVDHEMLDEAVAFAGERSSVSTPRLA
jgi:hypothetical protein